MKPLLTLLLAAAALLLAACADSHARTAALPAPPPAATFKAGHGLKLSPAALAFTGVTTAEFTGRLPASALLRTAKGDFVYTVNGDWLLRTPVTLAPDGLTVTAGLYEGDRIATHGVRHLWLAELQATNGGVGCADGH
jgi:hypothetical protein